jgi:regulator of sirC expression with transglutaminase-like and TPR domain
MSELSNEINALLQLIDDPDDIIFQSVSDRFAEYGDQVVPLLMDQHEYAEDDFKKNRLGLIIDNIAIRSLSDSLIQWKKNEEKSILDGAFILNNLIQREANRDQLFRELEKIRKSIWLELNEFLTPLEIINIFNKIIFDHFKLTGTEMSYLRAEPFSLGSLIEFKTGNSFSFSALYLIMSEMLGLGLHPVDIHKQNLLCYTDESSFLSLGNGNAILFFLDPTSGQVYTFRDIENYYKKIGHHAPVENISTASPSDFIRKWLLEFAKTLPIGSWKQEQIRKIGNNLI